MKQISIRYALILGLAILVPSLVCALWPASFGGPLGTAEAVVGAPATPVSYAGVARRSTVATPAAPVATAAVVTAAVVTPGVGAPGVGVAPGVGAPGVGVQPANVGGPVNRVGIR